MTTEKSSQKLDLLSAEECDNAISSLRRIVQFETVSATACDSGAYTACALYLQSQLRSIGCFLERDVFFLEESPDNAPVVVAVWKGTEPDLPVVLLNSHYDVVPAAKEDWTVNPFEAVMQDNKIYGRGTQDMKCVCIQYVEAIRKLFSNNYKPTRSIYLTFVPDEEVGGAGMAAFLSSSVYENLPGIAVALDEGLASTSNVFSVFYGERLPWWVSVTAFGNTGHGSRFIENTAVEQLIDLMNKALAFRNGQRALLHGTKEAANHSNCAHSIALKNRTRKAIDASEKGVATLGDVTSLNITTIEAGVRVSDTFAYNCVPPTAKCSFDIRISPHVQPVVIKNMITDWCKECSLEKKQNNCKISWSFVKKGQGNDMMEHSVTSMDGKVNPWYDVFSTAMCNMGLEFTPEVFPAATDSRFLRALGIRALGFSPMRNSEILLHENDEHILKDVFLEGVSIYIGLIEALASQGRQPDEKKRKSASITP